MIGITRRTAVLAGLALLTWGTVLPEAMPQERGAGDAHGGSASRGDADSDTRFSEPRRGRDYADLSRDTQRVDHAP